MIETLPEIVKALREISDWPWKRDRHTDGTYSVWDAGGDRLVEPRYNLVDTNFITLSPERLAQMVVGWVEERAKRIHYSSDEITRFDDCTEKENDIKDACNEFGISRADWLWLKEKVGE